MKVAVTQEWSPGSFGCQRMLGEKLILQQWQWREAGDPLLSGWLGPVGSAEKQPLDTKTYKCRSPLSGLQIPARNPQRYESQETQGPSRNIPGGAGSQQAVLAPGREWLLGAEGRGKVRPTGDLGWNPLKFTNLILSWFCSRLRGSRHFLFSPNQLSNLQREDKGAPVIFPKPSTKSMTLLCPETPKMSVEVRTLNSFKEEYYHSHIQW